MPQTNVSVWLDFLIQQIAAESYFDGVDITNEAAIRLALIRGNNRPGFDPPSGPLPGKTQLTDGLADRFLARYEIRDHHADDSTGFSATLLYDTQTNSYTLSFRSTEFRAQVNGGDRERDGVFAAPLTFAADGEIGADGFAFGQLAAMEHYYLQLTTSGVLPAGATLNVTGYSLGSHLATIFTELHANDPNIVFGHTYTFNGAGRGHITGPGASEAARIDGMLDLVREVLFNPDAGLPHVVDGLTNARYLAAAALAGQPFTPFASEATLGGAGNIYTDARYRWAVEVATTVYDTDGVQTSPGEVGTSPAFAKITQLYGLATTGDLNVVSNSGVHAPSTPVFIEGQPLIEGVPLFQDQADFGNTHAITLLVDSLAVQELIQTIDASYGQASAELLIKASSNAKADTVAPLNVSDVAEGDSLELTVDALRKLFVGPNPAVLPLPVDSTVGGFGNIAFRNELYAAMQEVKDRISVLQTQQLGITFTLTDLTNPTSTAPTVAGIADTDTDQGLAYRYALKELNPFAVVANTPQANTALYQAHNDQGQLSRVSPTDGTGTLTTQYLDDRALFLKEKIALNQLDHATSTGNIHFKDFSPNGLDITTTPSLRADREFLFGSDDLDTLTGGSKDDHLYGGGSVDVLIGNARRDYLEGNGGSDRLEGGTGADTMVGGAGNDTYLVDDPGDQVIEVGDNGTTDTVESSVTFSLAGTTVEHLTLTGTADLNGSGNELDNLITGNDGINRLEGQGGTDHLIGGIGNDVLLGGTGNNDLLEGGAGFDTYSYNAGDGVDQIEDSDATGKIVFNGGLLQGGISTDGGATYASLDGTETYILSGGHLIVNGVLTVNADFQSGQFGIQLDDLSSYATNTGVPTGPFQDVRTGTAGADFWAGVFVQAGNNGAYYGFGGRDVIFGDIIGNNLLDGGEDDDFLRGESGGDEYLDGGAGNDYLVANVHFDLANPTFYDGIFDGTDILLGGAGDDVLIVVGALPVGVAPDPDYLDGGAGNDYLRGGVWAERLLGGDGNDTLRGENLPDGWPEAFILNGGAAWTIAPGQAVFSATGGADFLDGGAGNDLLVGDGGDDILSGGADNDQLFGDDEAGYLVVPGDDVLDGGAGDDLLAGGDGNDSLSGGTGIDQLFGDKGVDVLDGGEDVDTLHGGDGADELFGGAGADLLYGDGLNNQSALSTAGGADFVDGGAGDDHLEGGIGDDTLFGGTGNDVLFGEEGADSLLGDDGADELQGGEGNDLLSGDAGDDRLFGQADNDTLYGDEGNDQLAGNDGADTLVGGNGNDVLEGGKGADVLVGGAGQDLYNFSLGDGADTITDRALAGEGNLIQFFGGITLGSLAFIQDEAQQTLTIQVAGGDSIRLLAFDPNTFNYVVDSLSFANGTQVALADQLPLPGGLVEGTDDPNVIRTASTDDTVFAGAGNDVVFAGAGNDVLIGGLGADALHGGTGQDAYVFNAGDGADTISDAAGEGNRLVFGAGVSAGSLTLGVTGEDALFIGTGVAGDTIRILDGVTAGNLPVIDTIEFADGSTLTVDQLLAQGIGIVGTANGDLLTGTSLNDRISGLAGDDIVFGGGGADIVQGNEGNDQLFGGDGNDTLDGGTGADVLQGDAGEDIYVFGRGYGQDSLRDSPVEQSGPNTIQLTSGVSPEDIRLQARQSDEGVDVVLTINGTQDELALLGAADPSLLSISQIRFADGTMWDTAEILDHIEGAQSTASATGSFLEGTEFRDVLIGAQGNDQLDGRGGADRMVGGAGDDMYWVNQSGDAVVEALGEGQDTVLSQIDYTLPEHVETLFLRSTAQPATDPVRGEGNAAANLLLGNFVNNVLVGGAGDDILYGGFSIGSDYGPGDDDLYGGAGNDSYVIEGSFNGFDRIHDTAFPGEGNRLQFGNSVRPEDVVFVQEAADLRITNSGGTDGAVLVEFDPSGVAGSLVTEVVAFSGGYEDVTGGYETRLLALMNPTVGTANAETLTGTANAEVIKAQAGDDVIAGGAGNDVLLGGAGSDTYLFNQGDGFDLIDDQPSAGDTNIVQFGAGITPDMLRVFYSGASGTGGLSVRIGTSGDGLHFLGVSADDPTASHAIDTFHFADGTQLTFAQLFEREIVVQGTGRSDGELFGTVADDRMNGFGGSETLSSQAGNDILEGGAGNDVLSGGEGEDTYVFNLGDGIDRIEDDAELIDDGQGGHLANNRILFGPGIFLPDLTFVEVDGTIRKILVGSNGDSIELPNFVDFTPGLRTISFSDGLTVDIYDLRDGGLVTDDQIIQGGPGGGVLIGGAGNDFIQSGGDNTALIGGAGDDTLDGGTGGTVSLFGGLGNDQLFAGAGTTATLSGGAGNNVLYGGTSTSAGYNLGPSNGNNIVFAGSGGNNYIINAGNSSNRIQIPDWMTAMPQGTAQFQGGYDTFQLSLGLGSLLIRYGTEGGELHIVDFDPNDVFAPGPVQRFEFTDRVLTYDDLIALGFDIDGTGGNDILTGTNTTDRFVGLTGNDDLSGGAGADTLTGGQGNDQLRGGADDDTYVFNLSDGIDTIQDTALAGEGNRIQFGTGITQLDLTFVQDSAARTLTIQVGTSGADKLTLTNFDPTGANGSLVVETLAFADGSQASLAALLGGPVNHAPTVANPIADQTVLEDAPFNLQIPANAFVDQDAGDTLIYSASLADGNTLPTWLSFDDATRTFTGTPDDAQVGNLDLRVTATDSGNLSVSDEFTLTVTNVNEAPAVAAPLADQQATEDAPFSLVVPTGTFADVDAGDMLTYSASLADGSALPTWLSFDAATLTLSGTPLNGDVGTVSVAVRATDLGGLSATDTFALTVQNVNDAPTVANLLADQQATQGTAFTLVVAANTFADVDVGDTLTYSAQLANGSPLPAWLSFNATTRIFTGTPQTGDVGTIDVRVIATDTGALSASDIFALTVNSHDQVLTGTAGNDILTGGIGNDQLFGLAGSDTLTGGAGNDLLDGGTGTDTMQGGAGNDTYVVDATGDVVTELANEGTDTVQSSITYTLAANVENLTLTGTANLNGTGNVLDNILSGNSGSNVLTGGAGNDTYVVGAGDTVVENAGGGTDTVQSAVAWTLSLNVENLTLTGTANINGTGSSANNVLIGNSGSNALDGGSGNDTVDGGDGNDSLLGGSGDDTLLGGLGNDTLNAGSGNDVLNGGDGTDTLDGGSGDDQLLGGTGTDTLTGGSGADQFTGGTGNDTMTGGSGNDVYNFSRGNGQDTIIDSDPFPGNQDRAIFGATINPLDLVISRQVNDLRLAIHGSSDQITVQNWYLSTNNRIETIQAGNGQMLLSTQVDQLIQAMASFSQQSGLTWDQAIDQQPQNVQTVLAGSWQ